MLRITREGDPDRASLRLEGRVEGPWVEVLGRAWDELTALCDGRKVTVDLGAVSFADRDGRALLLELQKKGAVLAKVSGFLRQILTDGDEPDGKGE